MNLNNDKSVVKNNNNNNNNNVIPSSKGLTILQTCFSGMIMGFFAYNGSFSIVPIFFTITALSFGTKSLITIMITAFSQLVAGYFHTHSSRTGMAISTELFHGFYISKPEKRNRRQYGETRWNSLKRFFILDPMNGLVINFMWETFTFFYLMQSNLFLKYVESSTSNIIENQKRNKTIVSSSIREMDSHLIIVHGITRYLAGCLAGMSTGMINQLWQRNLAQRKFPCALFNKDKNKLKLKWNERKKLLTPFNIENWIKAFTMLLGALFFIASNVANRTRFHLLDIRRKRIINDLIVIHGGWFFIRDCEMLLLKHAEKDPQIASITTQLSVILEETKIPDDEQSQMLPTVIET
ncbi:unnamed protein product [Rotaria sp. Silwood1]|nr:unnamed protein product [Rotaria sp. Silwood1]CAF1638378.1 unnamed protein product [Rotaria sp. Silwood1]CAF3828317.1 unnamed protein product [Rotaria sp. Silwood1]CAF3843047.1 unnamed protein product [Rotaria sp. Silwood1]CAF4839142.1 unnamed protein product [Rotaria sp. Silwood1]